MTDPKVTEEVGDAAELDLARYIRPGALVAWGQGCAEPLTLTEALAGQRQRLGGVRCFSGISTTAAVRPEHCAIPATPTTRRSSPPSTPWSRSTRPSRST
jgi:hypothetical protein